MRRDLNVINREGWVIHRQMFGALPFAITISVSPDIEADPNTLRAMQEEFRSQIRAFVRRTLPVDVGSILGNISVEVEGGAEHTWRNTIYSHEIIDDVFLDLMENVQQSNEAIDLSDLTFKFIYLLNGETRGAGGKVPDWVKKTIASPQCPDDINCAAWFLCHQMYRVQRRYKNDAKGGRKKGRQAIDARALMVECNWGKEIRMDDLATFVKKYPKRAIHVFADRGMKTGPFRSYVGNEFQPTLVEGKITHGDNLYLYYFYETKHFYYGCVPSQHALSGKLGDSFCHGCLCSYESRSGHVCDFLARSKYTRSDRNDVPCKMCDVIHTSAKDCLFVDCSCCKDFVYKKRCNDQIDADYKPHRCVINSKERDAEKFTFMVAGDAQDGKKTSLWAWDCESRIERSIERRVRKAVFAYDEDGRFCGCLII